ncbi:ribosomal 60S subunit protein L34A [Saccharomycopsis crataegensis]|uniref:Ribosomal 60S subunit protein L34A n=1 Tax=Saccharomycopsis crataegensis TaxID=43959 RepID=A0AAV5QE37_9ASCO|nr:ribosomal 60S subunit protein L34A [Saccharomycopsis crataegensis]
MAQRITFRKRNPYNTRSNQVKVVKTPGGILKAQHVKKTGTIPKCGDTGVPLKGISALRPRQYANVSKTHKTVSRAYGGSRSANAVKERIVRAFLIEEQKIVKRVIKEQSAKEAAAEAKKSKKAKKAKK